jgi:Zn-dependent peptidase ImmA (M78 family)
MPENDGFHAIQELFNFYENVLPPGYEIRERDLRSVSARIPASAYEELERLSERWGVSRSALAAQLLQTALNEVELREAMQVSKQHQDDESKAAL